MFAAALNVCQPLAELNAMLEQVQLDQYRMVRALIDEIRAPAARCRPSPPVAARCSATPTNISPKSWRTGTGIDFSIVCQSRSGLFGRILPADGDSCSG